MRIMYDSSGAQIRLKRRYCDRATNETFGMFRDITITGFDEVALQREALSERIEAAGGHVYRGEIQLVADAPDITAITTPAEEVFDEIVNRCAGSDGLHVVVGTKPKSKSFTIIRVKPQSSPFSDLVCAYGDYLRALVDAGAISPITEVG